MRLWDDWRTGAAWDVWPAVGRRMGVKRVPLKASEVINDTAVPGAMVSDALVFLNGQVNFLAAAAPQQVVNFADQSFSVTAFASVADMAFQLTAGQRYGARFVLPWTAQLTNQSPRFALFFNGSPAVFEYQVQQTGSATTSAFFRGANANDVSTTGTTSPAAAPAQFSSIIDCVIVPDVTEILYLRAASSLAGGVVTLKQGAYGVLWKAPV